MLKKYLECGKIQNTHGVRGLLRVGHLCDTAELFCALPEVYLENGGEYRAYKVASAAQHGAVILLGLEGIDSYEAAVALKNRMLFAKREDLPLPAGSHFIADLIGLPVSDAVTGKRYGVLTGVVNRGAGDVYEIKTPGGEALVPAVPEFIRKVDPESGIFITPIEGMIPDEI